MFYINELYSKKAEALRPTLKHKTKYPQGVCELKKSSDSFQGYRIEKIRDFNLPIYMEKGDKILLDFGDHLVGYLTFSVNHPIDSRITDSPIKFKFSFGEFPLEIASPAENYKGTLGSGWIQSEERQTVFTPYTGTLERRYAFRYLLIERTDKARFPINITDLSVDCVSAVDIEDLSPYEIKNPLLKKIYDISLKTLKECEQEVFEDGPKRDRRLWIGDLRLQALTDYKTFKNYDLIKRCIYLFAAYRAEHKMVASCMFPDSYPHVDKWVFADYSLFFISCLYDYYKNTKDIDLIRELYDIAYEQAQIVSSGFDEEKGYVDMFCHIDWCPSLEKDVSLSGVYIYTLKQLNFLAVLLKEDTAWIDSEIKKISNSILKFYCKDKHLFISSTGQISWHSQIWGVLSEVLIEEENIAVLKAIKNIDTEFIMRTPYMIHYYIEALFKCGLKEQALYEIKDYWGKILECGLDCFPEIFNPNNEFESPYSAPELNSACHAWSCTPAYWIYKYYNNSEG